MPLNHYTASPGLPSRKSARGRRTVTSASPPESSSLAWLMETGFPGFLLLCYPIAMQALARRREATEAFVVDQSAMMQIAFTGLCAAALMFKSSQTLRLLRQTFRGPLAWIAVYLLLGMVSTLWSEEPKVTLFRSGQALVFFLLCIGAVSSVRNLQNQLKFLAALSLISALSVQVIVIRHDPSLEALHSSIGPGTLIGASFLCWVIEGRVWKTIYYCLIALLILGTSLASFIAAGTAVCAGLLIFGSRRFKDLGLALMVVLALIAYLGWVRVEEFALAGKSMELAKTGTGRFPVWEWSLNTLKDTNHLWLGFGFGVGDATARLHNTEGLRAMHMHNAFLSALMNCGFVGLGFFCLFWQALFSEAILTCSDKGARSYGLRVHSYWCQFFRHGIRYLQHFCCCTGSYCCICNRSLDGTASVGRAADAAAPPRHGRRASRFPDQAVATAFFMRITYVARAFLDYRIPVVQELQYLAGGAVFYIFSEKWTPARTRERMKTAIGDGAICLTGERSIGVDMPMRSNGSICIPFQPGLFRAIARTKPDVVVGDGFFQWTFAALMRRILKGTPLVICYERWSHVERNAQWYRKVYRQFALRLTDAICCNGSLSQDYTKSLGFPEDRITVGHMAADAESLAQQVRALRNQGSAASGRSPSSGTPIFLFVGRLIPIKGLGQLLAAWEVFQKDFGQISLPHNGSASNTTPLLMIVGDGPERQSLEMRARANGLNVRFVGAVDYARIAEFYAAADVLIIPTLEDNWSLVVPEAMACGLPILCSKYNGCWPELVHEDRNGWVFDSLEPADIVRCLQRCRSSCGRLPEMGQESARIVQDYTPRKAAAAILRTCEIALRHRSRQSCPK